MIIYKTTNQINGKFYVGQDSKNNPDYLGSGLILNRAINKYGKDNFVKEIIEECSSKEELNEREIYWINKLDATKNYNIAIGGNGGDTYTNNPNLDKIKKKLTGENNGFYGKKHTEETKRKMSESQKGRKPWNKGKSDIYSDEHKQRLSDFRSSMTGDTSSRYIHIEKSELENQLKTNTIKDTAEYFKVSVSCIRRKISDYNLVTTKKSGNFEKPLPQKLVDRIISLRKEGKTIINIAEIVGLGRNKTKRVLINNGISTKRNSY